MSLKGLSIRLACREQTSFQLPHSFLLTSIMACPEISNCYGPVSFQFNAHQLYTALEKHSYRYSSVHTMRSRDLSSEGLISRGVQHSQGSDPFERDLSPLNTDLPGPWESPSLPRIALQERTLSEHTWPQSQRLKGLLTLQGNSLPHTEARYLGPSGTGIALGLGSALQDWAQLFGTRFSLLGLGSAVRD
uniref:Uncharacterized protein n=1 Tax=Pipistrellus kuhlii TaxID=59472 RepID=A0A7J7YNI3_PIPKU|nr:hypothetical protein mPipKuh1_010060 [Pipistrellus kuhlii]